MRFFLVLFFLLASPPSLSQTHKLSPRLLHRLETPTPIIAIYDRPQDGCLGRVCVITASPSTLINHPDLVSASLPTTYRLRNDCAAASTGLDALRIHQSLTGSNTLIAIIDTGLDWTHDDFIDQNGNTRVAWLLDQTTPATGAYPALEALGSGAVYSAAEIQRALDGETGPIWESARDVIGHGTHIAGVAAASDERYPGAAPGARLVIVKAIEADLSGFTEENVLQALAFVEEIARRERQPLVLNLSLGNHMGAHDGTTPIEVALDDMASSESPRIAVVVAAGNERNRALHARAAACSICLPTRLRLVVPSGGQPAPERPARIVLDFWHSGSGELALHLVTPSGHETDRIGTRGPYGLDTVTDDGLVEMATSQEPHPLNGEHRTTITLKGEAGQPLRTGVWEVVFEGRAERIDGWVGEYDLAGPGEPHFANYVDPANLVGPPATGLHTIAVGAFVSRNNWQDIEGTPRSLPADEGTLAYFSSPGPTRDGRTKPEVVAPGHTIISSLSHYSDPRAPHSVFYYGGSLRQVIDQDHAVLSGTSVASPLVAGLLALMLESNPDLTADQLQDALAVTAKSDWHTGSTLYDPEWGFGKPQAETMYTQVTDPAAGNLDPKTSLCGTTQPWLPPDGLASILAVAVPKDANGLPLGPDQNVTIEAPGATFDGEVHDHQNGIYTRRLTANGLRGSELKITCKANNTRIHATPKVRLSASHQEMSATGATGGACNCSTGNTGFPLLFLLLITLSARKIRSC
jgi:subtilisin family serine protease